MLRRLGHGSGVKDLPEGVEDGDAIGEDAVRQQECVEEIDGEEAQVGQAFQQSLRSGVAYLRHLRITHQPHERRREIALLVAPLLIIITY